MSAVGMWLTDRLPSSTIVDSEKSKLLVKKLIDINRNALSKGLQLEEIKNVCSDKWKKGEPHHSFNWRLGRWIPLLFFTLISVFLCVILKLPLLDGMVKNALGIKCVIPNNYFVWEATRPIMDCRICKGVNGVLVLQNVTRDEFQRYAFTSRPVLVKGAALHWPAMELFSFHYLKNIFERIDGAYEGTEDCQFLTFKTNFLSLRDVFQMPRRRAMNADDEKPWYIGWSNCYQPVLTEMRRHYTRPHFLPVDAEHAHEDYIFMGYQQGAVMHLDYISRLMWQAQLRGRKTWRLNPPPECESVCQGFGFQVSPGDIFLLDTRQWYHDTYIENGEFSLTVSSEYG